MSYTAGMKTAVSIPDDIFKEADRAARRLKWSRSRLYAEALREYLARRTPAALLESLREVYGQEDNSLPADIAASQAEILRRER